MGGLVEKPDKKTNHYQISQKGKEFLANPPVATPKKPKPPDEPPDEPPGKLPSKLPKEPPGKLPKEPPAGSGPIVPKKSETAKDDSVIPSQADIFRSIAQQLSISKAEEAKGGTPLESIINFVERTADLGNQNRILHTCNRPRHLIIRNPVPSGNQLLA